ncbi:hypothetical protein [Neobacillus vireti]|uniref:hypothetical protein n=1 Tax=Neobacillus vireti TaxID=220686 RepID=UPI002FFE0F6C
MKKNKKTESSVKKENFNSILVATSIGPNRIEIQRSAINTWITAGLNVVSLNTKEEVDKLKPYFPDIEFRVVERNAKEKYGKPYIYIYDIMSYLKSTDYKVVGIINSDIQFRDLEKGLVKIIYKEALDSLVYGHRLDVKHINDSYGTLSNGVDYFFINKYLLHIYQDDGLCMGRPAWDWWMVCVLASKNIPTKRILNPLGFHVTHPQQWNENLNQDLIESIVKKKYLSKMYPGLNSYELNSKMWEIVISKNGIIIK